jgi:hypothetical protein
LALDDDVALLSSIGGDHVMGEIFWEFFLLNHFLEHEYRDT